MVVAHLAIFAIILLSGTLALHNAQIQEGAARRYIEAERVVDLIELIEQAVTHAEAGQRGYLLTGQRDYLEPYWQAVDGSAQSSTHPPIRVLLGELARSAQAHAQLGEELSTLSAHIDAKLTELQRTVELYQAGREKEALALVRSGTGKDAMDHIRAGLARLSHAMDVELRELDRKRSEVAAQAYLSAAIISLLSVVALFALLLATRKVNRRIAQAQARVGHFFESDLFGITLSDAAGGIERANDEYLRIIGYSRDDLENGGLRWDTITPPEWLEIERGYIDEARKTGRGRHYEKEIVRKDGKRVPVLLGLVFTDEARHHLVAFVLDITEQKRSQEQLRRQEEELQNENRRKDEFIAMLAHELRNPLAPIQTGLDLMRMSPSSFPGFENTLTIMDRQLGHLVRLIDDLLDVSRINAGKLELRLECIAAVDVVNAALEAIAPQMAEARQTLDLDLPEHELFLHADLVRLTQVLNNLLNNAVRYTPQGGRIRLAVRRDGRNAVFEVKDNGIGIEPEMQPMVFDIFAQAGSGRRMRRDGLGLGLPLAKRLVQMHGGSIALHSAPGQGSSFIVSIPAVEAIAPAATEPAGASAAHAEEAVPAWRSPKRILVLDDNVDAANLLGTLLGAQGHQIGYAHCGADAIALAGELQPDIAFLDIGLPDMSGYDVARELRRMPALARTRLVALTGWGAERDKQASREAGIDLHLTKPARIEEIRALIPELDSRVALD